MSPTAVTFDPCSDLPDLEDELWTLIGRVPNGRVTTCGALAAELGAPQAARWIGHVLQHHDHGADCACHRVVRSEGRLGEYPSGGIAAKIRRLRREGIEVRDGRIEMARYEVGPLGGRRPLARLSHMQQALGQCVVLRGSDKSVRRVAGVDVSYAGGEAVAAYALCELNSQYENPLFAREGRVREATNAGSPSPQPTPKGRGGRCIRSSTFDAQHCRSPGRGGVELLGTTLLRRRVTFPYISSLLAFREVPILLELIAEAERAGTRADVLLVDGSGVLHPRGCFLPPTAARCGCRSAGPTGSAATRHEADASGATRRRGSVPPDWGDAAGVPATIWRDAC